MSDMPWFQFYPGDWLAGTRGMSAAETGVYISLIATMYDRRAPIPYDTAELARMCGATKKQLVAALNKLVERGKIVITQEGVWNARVESELKSSNARRESNKKAAEIRWAEKNKEIQNKPDADASKEQSKTDPISEVRSQKSEVRKNNTAPVREPVHVFRPPEPVAESDAARRSRELAEKLRKAAGWESHPNPMLAVTGPIEALIEQGASLEQDVLPIIAAKAAKCSSPNWPFFVSPIRQAMTARLTAGKPLDGKAEADRAAKKAAAAKLIEQLASGAA